MQVRRVDVGHHLQCKHRVSHTMIENILSVREIQPSDIDSIIQYWIFSDAAHFLRMGVDINKIPEETQLRENFLHHINTPIEQRRSYCIIWQVDGKPVGHSNTNPSFFGEEAFMHLHIWDNTVRKKGLGAELVKMTLPYFFNNLQLKKLYCEPYALNPSPNRTLEKVGFEFEKEYITTPGAINFEQPVNRWVMTVKRFQELNSQKQDEKAT